MARSDSLELFNRLETSVRSGLLKPVYLFCGKEKYLIERGQQLIIEQALAPHERDFNLTIAYGGDVEAQAVLSECASYPTMAARRVVILREFDQLPRNELFVAYAARPNPQTILVLVGDVGLNVNPYAAISKAAETFKFETVPDRRIPGWIGKAFQERGYKISGEAVEMLKSLAGSDLHILSNEIEKLITYVGDRKNVGAEDVLEVAGQSSEHNVFELQRRVTGGDFVGSERILDQMLQVSSNRSGTAIMTVTLLASYFTKLMKLSGLRESNLRPGEIAKKINVPAFTVSEYKSALRMVGSDGIARANVTLVGADYELKGGTQRDEWLILTMMLRRLTGGKKRNIGNAAA